MSELPLEAIGQTYTDLKSPQVLEELVDIGNRMGGQVGEREGALIVQDYFNEVGLADVETTSFDIDGWWRGSTALSLSENHNLKFEAQHEILALPGTPSGHTTAKVVDVNYGRPEDFDRSNVKGNIVMVSSKTPETYGRWIHRMEKYANAVKRGAVGFLFRNHINGCRSSVDWRN